MPKICERAADVKSMHKQTHTHTYIDNRRQRILLIWILHCVCFLHLANHCQTPCSIAIHQVAAATVASMAAVAVE